MSTAFTGATAVFSIVTYFLIEPLPPNMSIGHLSKSNPRVVNTNPSKSEKRHQTELMKLRLELYGRRKLMLQSLGSVAIILAILTSLLQGLSEHDPHRLGVVTLFVFLFAACYAPGAGAVPFLYSVKVWLNEARDVSMSLGVLVNFTGMCNPVVTFCN